MAENSQDQPTQFFAKFPNTDYRRLIVRHPYQNDSNFAMAYRDAAERLASTYRGEAPDDIMLLPFLMLYRHAIELQLKEMIRAFASLRRRFHDPNNFDLLPEAIEKRLRSHLLGHNLQALSDVMLEHYHALEFQEDFPASTGEFLQLLHDADISGTAFRYSGKLPDTQDRLDFPNLAELLDNEFRILGAAEDSIVEMYSAGPQLEDESDWR